jgi:hypothetical protein
VAALERRSEGELGRGGATAARPCRQRGGEGAVGVAAREQPAWEQPCLGAASAWRRGSSRRGSGSGRGATRQRRRGSGGAAITAAERKQREWAENRGEEVAARVHPSSAPRSVAPS